MRSGADLMVAALNPQVWWWLARATGIVAWCMVTASIVWGLTLSSRLVRRRKVPAWLLDLHRYLGHADAGVRRRPPRRARRRRLRRLRAARPVRADGVGLASGRGRVGNRRAVPAPRRAGQLVVHAPPPAQGLAPDPPAQLRRVRRGDGARRAGGRRPLRAARAVRGGRRDDDRGVPRLPARPQRVGRRRARRGREAGPPASGGDAASTVPDPGAPAVPDPTVSDPLFHRALPVAEPAAIRVDRAAPDRPGAARARPAAALPPAPVADPAPVAPIRRRSRTSTRRWPSAWPASVRASGPADRTQADAPSRSWHDTHRHYSPRNVPRTKSEEGPDAAREPRAYRTAGHTAVPRHHDLRAAVRRGAVAGHPRRVRRGRHQLHRHRRRLPARRIARDGRPHRGDHRAVARGPAERVHRRDEVRRTDGTERVGPGRVPQARARRRSTVHCGGSAPTTSTCTSCTSPTRRRRSTRPWRRSTPSSVRARPATSAARTSSPTSSPAPSAAARHAASSGSTPSSPATT